MLPTIRQCVIEWILTATDRRAKRRGVVWWVPLGGESVVKSVGVWQGTTGGSFIATRVTTAIAPTSAYLSSTWQMSQSVWDLTTHATHSTIYRESGYVPGITSKTNTLTTYKRKTMLIHQLPKKRHKPSNYVNPMHLVSNRTLPSASCYHRHLMLPHHPDLVVTDAC
jgi:hypothetical protein